MSLFRRLSPGAGNIYGLNITNKNGVSDLYVSDNPESTRATANATYRLCANGAAQVTLFSSDGIYAGTANFTNEWLSTNVTPKISRKLNEFSVRAKCTLFFESAFGNHNLLGTYETLSSTNLEATINTFGPWVPITSDVTWIASASRLNGEVSLATNVVIQIAKTADTSSVLDEATLEFVVGGIGAGGGSEP